jgi:C4-dicarboxylate transporter DctQ subunit
MFSVIDKVNSALRWFGVASVLLLTFVVVREVFMRFVFNRPSGWTIEISVIIQLAYGFLCAGYVLRQRAHITLESIFDYVRQKTRAILLMIGSIMGIIFCGIMVYYSWQMVVASFRLGDRTMFMEWPMSLIKLPVLIGFFLLGTQFVADTWRYYQQVSASSDSGA